MSLTEVFSTSVVPRRPGDAEVPEPPVTAELHRCAALCRSYVETAATSSLGQSRAPGDSAVALAASCAEICVMTASLFPRMERGVHGLFRSAAALCLEACVRCAQECDRGRDASAYECAEACRSVIRALAGMATEPDAEPHPTGRGPRWSVHPVAAT